LVHLDHTASSCHSCGAAHLADGRERLALRQVGGPRGEAQALRADRDRAAADQHHAVALRAQVAHGLADARQVAQVQAARLRAHQAGAPHLDYLRPARARGTLRLGPWDDEAAPPTAFCCFV